MLDMACRDVARQDVAMLGPVVHGMAGQRVAWQEMAGIIQSRSRYNITRRGLTRLGCAWQDGARLGMDRHGEARIKGARK